MHKEGREFRSLEVRGKLIALKNLTSKQFVSIGRIILTVYDDFATSEASVTHGSTNDEITTGVNVKFGVSVQIFGGNDRFDDFFEDIFAKSGQCDLQKESNMSKKCQNYQNT